MKTKVSLENLSITTIVTMSTFVGIEIRCDQCEQLCFPNAINQTEITCGCGQYYTLASDGRSCKPKCAE